MDEKQTSLERVWAGEFGDHYARRNAVGSERRLDFWRKITEQTRPTNVLEVGCNIGLNLRPLADILGEDRVHGVDVNNSALETLMSERPGISSTVASAMSLPFADESVDLVITVGVLIHIHPDSLAQVTGEIARCTRRFVFCGEYFAADPVEIRYRGHLGMLFKRDYGAFYRETHPELIERASGFLPRASGWDDITWWLFEKQRPRL